MAQENQAYQMIFLGSTTAYDVYDVIVYPAMMDDSAAQEAFKHEMEGYVARAKAARRKVWAANNFTYLTRQQVLALLYKLALSFVRQPIIGRSYGITQITPREDAHIGVVRQIIQSAFRHALVENRQAAMPPGFVPPSGPYAET